LFHQLPYFIDPAGIGGQDQLLRLADASGRSVLPCSQAGAARDALPSASTTQQAVARGRQA